jgi:hypothetical protein
MKQHQDGIRTYNPDDQNSTNISGITKHASSCTTGTINWDNPKILATFQDKDKGKLQKNLFIRESLEIRNQCTGPNRGLNDDFSKYVRTNAWGPLFEKMKK